VILLVVDEDFVEDFEEESSFFFLEPGSDSIYTEFLEKGKKLGPSTMKNKNVPINPVKQINFSKIECQQLEAEEQKSI